MTEHRQQRERGMIYILYHYGENGAENLLATTQAYNLDLMFDKVLEHPDLAYLKKTGDGYPETKVALTKALVNGKPGRYDLQRGWGGMVLQISEDFQS
jgi:hypothetical protein